jgi:hypothetical protein
LRVASPQVAAGADACIGVRDRIAAQQRVDSESWTIAPAAPPLPVCMNLPFNSGSHISNRMSDSAVARIVPERRQKAGKRE